jgi:phosphonate transport system substrate-binding protein
MINRRSIVLGAAVLAFAIGSASAQDYKAKYPELTFAVVPAENASGVTERWAPSMSYLSRELGVKVTLRIANDYAAVIESQRAGNAQLAFYGPASFARAVMTGVKIEPIVNQKHDTGASGYYSVIYVRADSPYKTIEDLKGKNLALVDPNSTSGNQAPRFFLHKAGHPVDAHFGKTVYAGSHENAVLALVQGTVDAAANLYNTDTDTMVTRMAAKGMLKKPDGTPLTQADFRVVFKSDFLPEGPFAMLASLPDDLKAKIRDALVAMPTADKAAFDRLSDGKDQGFTAVTLKDYQPIIEMLKFNDDQRRKS